MIVAGVDDLDADRTGIDVGLAGPERFAGVPGAPALLHELHDTAVLMDKIMAGDLAAGRFEQFERGVGIAHARIVQHDHIGAPAILAIAEIRRRIDLGDNA